VPHSQDGGAEEVCGSSVLSPRSLFNLVIYFTYLLQCQGWNPGLGTTGTHCAAGLLSNPKTVLQNSDNY
jgi:hypothetical protein